MSRQTKAEKVRFTLKKAYTQAIAELNAAEERLFIQLATPIEQRDTVLIEECMQVIDGIERELAFIHSQRESEKRRAFGIAPSLAALALCTVCVIVLLFTVIGKRNMLNSAPSTNYYASAADALSSTGIEADLPAMLSGENIVFCNALSNENGVRLEYIYNDTQQSENGYFILHISAADQDSSAVNGDYISALNCVTVNAQYTVPSDMVRNCHIAYTYNNTNYSVDTNLSLNTLVKILESVESITV